MIESEEIEDDPGTVAVARNGMGSSPPLPTGPLAPPVEALAPSPVDAEHIESAAAPAIPLPFAGDQGDEPVEIDTDEVRPIDIPLATTPAGGFITRHPPSMPSVPSVSDLEELSGPTAVAPSSSSSSSKPPVLAEKYQLERELARGAMGRVYLATQLGLNRKVAVKVMSPKLDDEDFRRRFTLEATGLANLSHRNIVTVYDHGESKRGLLYLVLEYLRGDTLAQVIAKGGPQPVSRTLAITAQVLRGLRAAHKKGLIHRDLKPSNIFIVRDEDGEDEVKILDFGIAKVFSSGEVPADDATRDGLLLGTPAFMSPEQIDGGQLGPWTDLYALGCVIFNLLSGRVPFPGKNDVEILTGHLKTPAPRLRLLAGCEQLPPGLENFVARLLEKDPSDRFADADGALVALRQLTTELLSSDAALRAEVSPDFVASLAANGSLGTGTGTGTGTGSSKARARPIDPALARIADGSSSTLDRGVLDADSGKLQAPTAPTGVPEGAIFLQPALPEPTPRSLPRAALLGTLAAAAVLVVAFWFTRGQHSSNSVTIEAIPAGIDLIAADGRVLGKSPVVLDTVEQTLQIRARIGDALSDIQTLNSSQGHVIADFSEWARSLGGPPPMPPSVPSVVPSDPANATPDSEDAPVVDAPGRSPAPRWRRPPPQPAPTVAAAPTPTPTPPTPTPPPPAPTKPAIGMLDDKAHMGALDSKPGIGLLDESPAVAPID